MSLSGRPSGSVASGSRDVRLAPVHRRAKGFDTLDRPPEVLEQVPAAMTPTQVAVDAAYGGFVELPVEVVGHLGAHLLAACAVTGHRV